MHATLRSWKLPRPIASLGNLLRGGGGKSHPIRDRPLRVEYLERRALMSVSPPSVPLPSPIVLTNPIDPIFQRALARAGGQRRPAGSAPESAPANRPARAAEHRLHGVGRARRAVPAPVGHHFADHRLAQPSPGHTIPWTENDVDYSATEVDTDRLGLHLQRHRPRPVRQLDVQRILHAELHDHDLRHQRQSPQLFASYASGTYAYTFTASGSPPPRATRSRSPRTP